MAQMKRSRGKSRVRGAGPRASLRRVAKKFRHEALVARRRADALTRLARNCEQIAGLL